MQTITLEFVQNALAKENIDFQLIVSGSPMPYHLVTRLKGMQKLVQPAGDQYDVIENVHHIIHSPTVHTHPNVIADRLLDALKQHPVAVKRLDSSTGQLLTYYYQVHDNVLVEVAGKK